MKHVKVKIQKFVKNEVHTLRKEFKLTASKDRIALLEARRLYDINHKSLKHQVKRDYKDLNRRERDLSRIVYIGVGVVFVLEIIFRYILK